jgi:2-oxoglutarate dehydrogenase E2 component (dihydrolipoamide succinyltransferase)
MTVELKIPDVGESVREVQIVRWLKHEGDSVKVDENLVELETEKATLELPAPATGRMGKALKVDGDIVAVGDVIGYLEQDDGSSQSKAEAIQGNPPEQLARNTKSSAIPLVDQALKIDGPQTKTASVGMEDEPPALALGGEASKQRIEEITVTPAARRALREHGLTAADMDANSSRIDREDVLRHVKEHQVDGLSGQIAQPVATQVQSNESESVTEELEEIVPMSLFRRRIAERLVQAQHQAALVTTFNEIDMTAVKQLRASYRESFQQKYGVKLGMMSFFVKAAVDALKEQPALNAEIRDNQIVYRHYYHIGIAIGSSKGLVVPVLRFAERLSFADIEQTIDDFSHRANENDLRPKDLVGGTFTISNGGIYGSLLSTPIVNPPQSGVLGMHTIQDRPVAHANQVVIRPMMYVALTYDHRLIDGREAVLFLKRIKDAIEDPARMLIET